MEPLEIRRIVEREIKALTDGLLWRESGRKLEKERAVIQKAADYLDEMTDEPDAEDEEENADENED